MRIGLVVGRRYVFRVGGMKICGTLDWFEEHVYGLVDVGFHVTNNPADVSWERPGASGETGRAETAVVGRAVAVVYRPRSLPPMPGEP